MSVWIPNFRKPHRFVSNFYIFFSSNYTRIFLYIALGIANHHLNNSALYWGSSCRYISTILHSFRAIFFEPLTFSPHEPLSSCAARSVWQENVVQWHIQVTVAVTRGWGEHYPSEFASFFFDELCSEGAHLSPYFPFSSLCAVNCCWRFAHAPTKVRCKLRHVHFTWALFRDGWFDDPVTFHLLTNWNMHNAHFLKPCGVCV